MLKKEEIQALKNMCYGLSIMIVEDEVVLAKSYKELASYFFDDVVVVHNAKSALQEFKVGRFDIIYTDINMPQMNGVELIRKIKNEDPNQQFVVMSASDETKNLLALLKLKISNFVLKPIQIDAFFDATSDQVAILEHAKKMKEQSYQLKAKLHEVTKQKKLQEEILIQQTKLAQTGCMISMIAHQWRQPLSSITTQLATLKTRLDLGIYEKSASPYEELSKELYKSFEKIEFSAGFLSKTINNFREFYRPENGQRSFNLRSSIEEILEMLMLEQNNIMVENAYSSSSDFNVETYEGELQQVLMSIINNARDALLEKKILKPRIKVFVEHKDETLKIEIIDNAGGVPEDIIDDIFLPYFSTKDEKNGTGIGLHMAKTIVEKHLIGSLYVKNIKEEEGACFTIEIPLRKEEKCTA